MEDDLYEILGVLPSAEAVVITAAYRALAQRYHPDRWTGDPTEAHARMAAINLAYETLKEPGKRAEYDAKRSKSVHGAFSQTREGDHETAFTQAMSELESRWELATSVFPDLIDLRARLGIMSTRLAFSFVAGLLETKGFNGRRALADQMEDQFLERYFGTDARIKELAGELIRLGARDAARTLNQLVDVLGSGVPADNLIARVHRQHGEAIEAAYQRRQRQAEISRAIERFRLNPDTHYLAGLCNRAGYVVDTRGRGLFKSPTYEVVSPQQRRFTFDNDKDFIAWGMKEFPPSSG